jgi:hypothetical protein
MILFLVGTRGFDAPLFYRKGRDECKGAEGPERGTAI